MKILALDSSGLVASVAVMEDDNLLAEYTMNYKKTHSQTLLPMLDEMAKMIDLDLNTVDAIAVVETDAADRPMEDIVIESITFESYTAK